ncbi:hypothetical protein FXO37_31838 [Capsicum annuum]|nr:hypothetical protein FXO37_31838 [Capsicum annuum]
MGNCCSDENRGGHSAVGGGTGAHVANQNNGHNEAVGAVLKSRGYQGLYTHVESLFGSLWLIKIFDGEFVLGEDIVKSLDICQIGLPVELALTVSEDSRKILVT